MSKITAARRAVRRQWGYGPLFALEALLVALSAKREMTAASEAQAAAQPAELARQP